LEDDARVRGRGTPGAGGLPRGGGGPRGYAPGDRLVTLLRCPNGTMAGFVGSILAGAGIDAVVQDEHMAWLHAFVLAQPGVRVQVRERDLAAAVEVLRHAPQPQALPAPEPGFEPAEPVPFELPIRCPNCGSTRVEFHPAEPEGFVIVLIEKVIPLPFLHGHWRCGDCGKRWLEVSAQQG